jgi:hypothetical protein
MSEIVEARLARYVGSGAAMHHRQETPQRTASVSDDVWDKARRTAKAADEKLSEVIRRELEAFVQEGGEI